MGPKRWRRKLNRAIRTLEHDLTKWLGQFEENPERIKVVDCLGDLIESRLKRKPFTRGATPEKVLEQEHVIFVRAGRIASELLGGTDEPAQTELAEAILLQVVVWCRYQAVHHKIHQVQRTIGLSTTTKAALVVGGIMSAIVIARKFSNLFNKEDEG